MRKETRLAIGDINTLLREFNSVKDQIAKVQREKDLKVDTINKKYEAKLEALALKESELAIIIKDTK